MKKLYKISKTGRVRVFYIIVVKADNHSIIEQYSGQLGGKIQVRNKYIRHSSNEGQINEKNPFERAKLLAEGIYKDKYGEGYKSKEMYLQTYTFQSQDISSLEAMTDDDFADLVVPHCDYNTNADGIPLPMLAEPIKDRKIDFSKPVFIQPKLNGVRCISIRNEGTTAWKLMSRGGQYYNIPNIMEELYSLYLTDQEFIKDLIFDGELYKHGKPLQEISGAARKESIDLFDARDWIEYHIYDIVDPALKQLDRLKKLKKVKDLLINFGINRIKIVKTKLVKNQEEVDDFHTIARNNEYEGAILRTNRFYLPSFRDSRLLKLKEFVDGEFKLLGCESKPDDIGGSFVFVLKNDITDRSFKCRPTGTLKQKEYWYNNIDSLIGKMVTVRYQERSADHIPTMAHVRAKGVIFEAIRDYE